MNPDVGNLEGLGPKESHLIDKDKRSERREAEDDIDSWVVIWRHPRARKTDPQPEQKPEAESAQNKAYVIPARREPSGELPEPYSEPQPDPSNRGKGKSARLSQRHNRTDSVQADSDPISVSTQHHHETLSTCRELHPGMYAARLRQRLEARNAVPAWIKQLEEEQRRPSHASDSPEPGSEPESGDG